jgi:ubiquinone/menaquinone biosynthesis C-methylase UbiE
MSALLVRTEAAGWQEYVGFMAAIHQYNADDARLVRQWKAIEDFRSSLRPNALVLDVGCGQGEMRQFFEPQHSYHGIDASIGDEKWKYAPDTLGDVLDMPLPDHQFDAAICLWVVEHVRDPIQLLREISRVVKPGGPVLMFAPFIIHEHQAPHDYFRYTRFGLRAIFDDAGYVGIRVAADSSPALAAAVEAEKILRSLRSHNAEREADFRQAQKMALDLYQEVNAIEQDLDLSDERPGLSYIVNAFTGVVRHEKRKALPTVRLNLGCGNHRLAGWINMDMVCTPAVDVVRDITRGLPFEDSSVDEILVDNVLEHIGPEQDFVFVLNELYRVLKPGALLNVIVPDARSQAGWQDPTHKRSFVPRSVLYWNQDLEWAGLYGITANFDVTVFSFGDMETEAFLRFECRARKKLSELERLRSRPLRNEDIARPDLSPKIVDDGDNGQYTTRLKPGMVASL